MLKKVFALCLCLALLASLALPAAAETDQLVKLQGQWKSSGFRGTLTGEVTGDGTSLTDQNAWETLRSFLATHQLSISHTVKDSNKFDGDESIVILEKKTGEEVGRLNILTDASGIIYLQSDLLDDAGLYYGFDSGFDWSNLLVSGDNGWPSLVHVITEISQASQTWKESANPYLEKFSLNISRWLQSYATTTTEQDVNGSYVMTTSYEIPVAAILQETRQLLADFYSDPQLLALLAQVLTAEETAAYLQTSMLLPFLQMLDNVKLSGTVTARRQYEAATGTVLYDSVSLPCPTNLPIHELTIVHVPKAEDGELWQLNATFDAQALNIAVDQELKLEVTAQNTDTDVWTGSVLALLPGSTDPEALNQEDQTLFSCTYNLSIPAPKDTNDYYQSYYERLYEAMLVVKPDEAMQLPAFSIGGSFKVYSKSSNASTVCHVESALAITDLDRESAVTLNFTGKTYKRWTPTMLTEAISSSLRMDMMSASSRLQLLGDLFSHFMQSLAQRVAQ